MSTARSVSLGLLLSLSLFLALLSQQAALHNFLQWDLPLAREIQSWDMPGFHQLMVGISYVGNGKEAWFVTMLAGLGLIFFGRGPDGGILLAGVGLASLFNGLLKYMVARPRPSADLLKVLSDFSHESFPSGHVTLYVTLFGFLLYDLACSNKPVSLRTFLAVLLAIPPLLVGISRVYLGAHWPSDVVGGYLHGFFWLILMIRTSAARHPERNTGT